MMVSVSISNKRNNLVLRVVGHADYGFTGQDVLCSAISMTTILYAQTVKDMYRAGMLAREPKLDLKSGETEISCKPLPEYREHVKTAISIVTRGYDVLAHNFPENIQIVQA